MTAGQAVQIPFYFDWKFWSVVASVAAIILSQLPPLHILFRRARLNIEVYSRMALMHKVGNPSAQIHLIVSNAGGKDVRIKGIELHFQRMDSEDRFTLPAQGYLQHPNDNNAVLLTPFSLKPNHEWGHIVNCFKILPRKEEKEYRELETNLRNHIWAKLRDLPPDSAPVPADEEYVEPIVKSFQDKFTWHSGEYELTVEIRTEPAKSSIKKKYRITLFESDSKELEDYCEDYKFGWGVFLDSHRPSVFVSLTEV